MAEKQEVRRALRQTGMPTYELPAGGLLARILGTTTPFAPTPAAAPAPVVVAQPAAPLIDTRAIGNAAQQAMPTLNAARENVVSDATRWGSEGQYARAAGAVLRGAVTYPVAAAADFGRPVTSLLKGVGNVIAGAFGSDGDTKVTKTPAPAKAVVAAAKAADPVAAAMAQGRAAPRVTAQDALDNYISSVLQGGATIREASALGPLVGQTVKQGQTQKDSVMGQTAALSQSIFQNQVAKAQELAKTDPATAKAEIAKATDAYFARNAGLVGFDPTKLALAEQLAVKDD